jgi:hypothetical protein
MKHLTKFIEYLKESKEELDLDLIVNDFLVPIKHLGVKISTRKSLETSGEFEGHNITTISFDIEHFERVDEKSNTKVKDKRLWELLDELIMFKNVMDETYGNSVTVWLGVTKIDIDIYSKIEEDDKYLIKKLNNELKGNSKIWTSISKEGDSIKVWVEGTKRVWDNYIRENPIDFSKFNLEFTDNPTQIAVRKRSIRGGFGVTKEVTHLNILITVKK